MTKVRYRVLAPCFVNGTLHQPDKGSEMIIEAAPGLDGPALLRVPDAAPPTPAATDTVESVDLPVPPVTPPAKSKGGK
jgi:hypothetical protein